MSNNTRKIVVLSKLNSPRIEQAIFILRDEVNVSESDAVSEAQRIVDNYLKSLSDSSPAKPPKKNGYGFLIGMTLYTFATVVITAYLLAFMK